MRGCGVPIWKRGSQDGLSLLGEERADEWLMRYEFRGLCVSTDGDEYLNIQFYERCNRVGNKKMKCYICLSL